jgi:hypothetical protein
MAFEKKRAFCVVVGRNGDRAVIEGLPEDGERMERPLDATSLLAAHKAAFGRLPDLDPGIRELVVVLNEIPGIQTWSSCEGHKRGRQRCVYQPNARLCDHHLPIRYRRNIRLNLKAWVDRNRLVIRQSSEDSALLNIHRDDDQPVLIGGCGHERETFASGWRESRTADFVQGGVLPLIPAIIERVFASTSAASKPVST